MPLSSALRPILDMTDPKLLDAVLANGLCGPPSAVKPLPRMEPYIRGAALAPCSASSYHQPPNIPFAFEFFRSGRSAN